MKKEYIDHLYNLKSLVQLDICRLSEICKEDKGGHEFEVTSNEAVGELRTRRSQLDSIDETIKKYLEIHGKTIIEKNKRLQKRDDWLKCLEAAGIDNWEGYDIAQDIRDSRKIKQLCEHKGTTIAWGPDADKCTKCNLTWDV